jgi:hypothetical protein
MVYLYHSMGNSYISRLIILRTFLDLIPITVLKAHSKRCSTIRIRLATQHIEHSCKHFAIRHSPSASINELIRPLADGRLSDNVAFVSPSEVMS